MSQDSLSYGQSSAMLTSPRRPSSWSKEFLEAGKKRLAGDTAREATSDEVKELKAEARQLKETLAEVLIENRLLKKSVLGDGEDAS